MSRCAKCRGLLPAWLEADAANARCPNCGHVAGTSAPTAPPKATNAYAPLDPQKPAADKSPSLVKTMMMGASTPAPAPPNPALAKTMMLGSAAPRPEGTPAPKAATPPPPKPAKRVATLPQGTEIAAGLERTTMLPATPAPARTTMLPSAPAPAPVPAAKTTMLPETTTPAPPAGAMPVDAGATDADISIELETPPPAPPSRKSLPAWVVPDALDDLSGATSAPIPLWQRKNVRLGAAGAGGALVLLVGVLMLGRRHEPAAEVHRITRTDPGNTPWKQTNPSPDPEPAAASVTGNPSGKTGGTPAHAADAKGAHAPAAKVAAAKPAPVAKSAAVAKPVPVTAPVARPTPVAAPAAARPIGAPAPERQVTVASPRHLAAVSPHDHPPSGAPSADGQQRSAEAYTRGNTQLFQGHVDEAIASFKESLKLDPHNPSAMRGLGLAYVQAGNAAQAVVFLKRYLKAAPTASDRALIEKRLDQLDAR